VDRSPNAVQKGQGQALEQVRTSFRLSKPLRSSKEVAFGIQPFGFALHVESCCLFVVSCTLHLVVLSEL
jgi:hypothetical protein